MTVRRWSLTDCAESANRATDMLCAPASKTSRPVAPPRCNQRRLGDPAIERLGRQVSRDDAVTKLGGRLHQFEVPEWLERPQVVEPAGQRPAVLRTGLSGRAPLA